MIKDENNPKLGFYNVGNKTFFNKPMALLAATGTDFFPEWNFNKEAFETVNWSNDPGIDLRLLYRMRAQHLRDKYDWIRLEFSGGADSTTVLYSFINNGIHIDEVVFRYPKTGEKNATDDPYDYRSENTLSEAKYAAYPILNWLTSVAPATKITTHDYSEDMIGQRYDESWVLKTKDYFQPGHVFKHSVLAHDDHKRKAETGQSICVLYGIDKPKVCVKGKKWYAYFIDITANHAVTDSGEYSNISTEYFYWSPDLPELIVRQCHVLKNWFGLDQNKMFQYLARWPNHSYINKTQFEGIMKPLIYPDYDPTTFQVAKATNSFYNEMDTWFYKNFQETHQYQTWKAGLNYLVNNIDAKFFNYRDGHAVGFVGFLSPFYYLGEADFVDSGRNVFDRF
jgi:hypothetical protein